MKKWGIRELRSKKQGFDWQQGCGADALVKAPKEKWGGMGGNGAEGEGRQ